MMLDMREAFAAVERLSPDMPFEIEQVDYLPAADPNCCATMAQKLGDVSGTVRVKAPWSGEGAGGCGAGGDGKSSCGAAAGETGVIIKTITGDGDTVVKHVLVPGATDGGAGLSLEDLDLEALGISPEVLTSADGRVKMVMVGSSDHAAFLAAGIPSFWWTQDVTADVPYYAHSSEDTYDKVPARCLEHSAAVIALGALGTANLDRMLSREVLADPAGVSGAGEKAAVGAGCGASCGDSGAKVTIGSGCGSSCGGAVKKAKSKSTGF
jgi:hypothetical protein